MVKCVMKVDQNDVDCSDTAAASSWTTLQRWVRAPKCKKKLSAQNKSNHLGHFFQNVIDFRMVFTTFLLVMNT